MLTSDLFNDGKFRWQQKRDENNRNGKHGNHSKKKEINFLATGNMNKVTKSKLGRDGHFVQILVGAVLRRQSSRGCTPL